MTVYGMIACVCHSVLKGVIPEAKRWRRWQQSIWHLSKAIACFKRSQRQRSWRSQGLFLFSWDSTAQQNKDNYCQVWLLWEKKNESDWSIEGLCSCFLKVTHFLSWMASSHIWLRGVDGGFREIQREENRSVEGTGGERERTVTLD